MPKVPLPKRNADGSYRTPPAGMSIDGDGANGQTGGVPVYAPKGFSPTPLDFLANAGKPGNWFGVVTDTGKKNGKPVKQNADSPAPGAYVSATSYRWPELARIDPLAYVDAASVPYIVLPGHWRQLAVGVVLGCKATVEDTKTGKILEASGVLDFGPTTKLGEASIACAEFFGVPSSPKSGGTKEARFIYTFTRPIAPRAKKGTHEKSRHSRLNVFAPTSLVARQLLASFRAFLTFLQEDVSHFVALDSSDFINSLMLHRRTSGLSLV